MEPKLIAEIATTVGAFIAFLVRTPNFYLSRNISDVYTHLFYRIENNLVKISWLKLALHLTEC